MSLKYRLIILTTVVFAGAFGVGTLLGVQGARHLAEAQLKSRLARSAEALATSGVQLSDDVLKRLSPLLDADILVIDFARQGARLAHSQAEHNWQELADFFAPNADRAGELANPWTRPDGRRLFFGVGRGSSAATKDPMLVVLLADESAVHEPTRTILQRYLAILCATGALLAGGMYVVGWVLVRRINRLARSIDQTLSEEPVARRRGGDELRRLQQAFDALLDRLNVSRRRLAAQQRLATAGKIASSVAHEVRNPLQAVRLTVQMLREQRRPEDRAGYDLILGEIDRLNLLTDELLVLAGKAELRAEPLDLPRELHETLRLMQFQLNQRDIRTELDLPPLPPVRMDRNRCRQLLLNLLLNAAEASPRGGLVRVECRLGDAAVVVRIADSGPGFPPEVLSGAAEEFFSTKTTGAGLGLSICRRIVQEAGGQLRLHNAAGGAVAEAVLPVDPDGRLV